MFNQSFSHKTPSELQSPFEKTIEAENKKFNIQEFLIFLKSLVLKQQDFSQQVYIGDIKIDEIESHPTVLIHSYLESERNINQINPHWASIQVAHKCLADLIDQESDYGNVGDVIIESENECYDPMNELPFIFYIERKIGSDIIFNIVDLIEDISSPEFKEAYSYLNEILPFSKITERSKKISLVEEARYRFFLNDSNCCFKVDRRIKLDEIKLMQNQCLEFYTKLDMIKYIENHKENTIFQFIEAKNGQVFLSNPNDEEPSLLCSIDDKRISNYIAYNNLN
jgi:hypothetical protein